MHRSVYNRPNKPLTLVVRSRTARTEPEPIEVPAPLFVDRATECHVTPQDVAKRMVEYIGPESDSLTLEPSAGMGALINALLSADYKAENLVAIERHNTLASALNIPGAEVINDCFLDYAQRMTGKIIFPRIIMNPPFSQVRKHMKAALSLLGCCENDEPAILVALVPITYQHEDAETLEILPDTTFSTARVNTKIIRIERQNSGL